MNLSLAAWRNILLGAVFALLVVGAIAIYSASGVKADLRYEDDTLFLRKHLHELLLGLVLMVGLAIVPPGMLRKSGTIILIAAELMLVAVLIPGIGKEYHGSRRWFSLAGTSFQPSEFAKIALLVFLAGWVAGKKRRELARFWPAAAIPIAAIILTALLVEREPDKSTAFFIVLVGSLILVVGGVRIKHLAMSYGALLLVALLLVGAAALAGKGEAIKKQYAYVVARITVADEYQVEQSLSALASGKATGVGPGGGLLQLGYLPMADSDFIFAIIGQDAGFLGTLGVIALFTLFVLSGLNIAFRTPERFPALLCFGLTAGIGLQAAIHVAVVSAVVPTTGIALPFISRGGSAMMMALASVGIVMSIARASAQGRNVKKRRVVARSVTSRRKKITAKNFAHR